jgi:mono/diheme cytochrome c family protein
MRALTILAVLLGATFAAVLGLPARQSSKVTVAVSTVPQPSAAEATRETRIDLARHPPFSLAEGERRFRQNCGRCHVAPDKFPPRMMATVLRHMRVRATITDEDARLILWYMTR